MNQGLSHLLDIDYLLYSLLCSFLIRSGKILFNDKDEKIDICLSEPEIEVLVYVFHDISYMTISS